MDISRVHWKLVIGTLLRKTRQRRVVTYDISESKLYLHLLTFLWGGLSSAALTLFRF